MIFTIIYLICFLFCIFLAKINKEFDFVVCGFIPILNIITIFCAFIVYLKKWVEE